MVYIPSSQIKENLFAQRNEWYYVKDNSPYTGFYYLLSNGTAYTGRNPNNPPNEEIFKKTPIVSSQLSTDPFQQESNTVEYANVRNRDLKIYGILTDTNYNLIKSIPQLSYTFPSSEDYDKGMFTRYFVCKINQLQYIEINKETYDFIDTKNEVWVWEDYVPFTLDWYIKGNIDRVFNNNKGLIFEKEKEINKKGLEDYLGKEYLQYFEYPEASNLTTTGGELITPTGEDYVGAYHIHKDQGPMEGAVHIQGAHRKLFYRRFYKSKIVNSLNQEGVIETGESQRIEFTSELSTDPNYSSTLTPSSMPTSTSIGGGSSGGGGY